MSRVGQKPIELESGIDVTINGQEVTVKGGKATLTETLPAEVVVERSENTLVVKPINESRTARAMWGLSRALVANMVEGATKGFEKTLEINGVGYRAQVQGKVLKLNLGFSHDVDFDIPEGITIATPAPTQVVISGADKQLVGQVAANIRKWRKPEPYKGKGIRYSNEYVRRKEGKKK